ncbi:MAG TPA: hypothetical protein VFG87_05225 [Amycolatopsis sp.]|nr:hypothetical protein [Amycolatopsis sp.]
MISAVVIDGIEPTKLPEPCRQISGWNITSSDEDYVYPINGAVIQLEFQRIDHCAAPEWPDHRRHFRLDFTADGVEGTIDEPVAPSAVRTEMQPSGRNRVLLTDPDLHPSYPIREN